MAIFLGGPNEIATFGNLPPGDVSLVSSFGWIGGNAIDSIITPNHTARALSLLIEEFKRSGGINSIVRVSVDEAQEVENVGSNLLTNRRLDQAGGAQLDGLGDIVGVDREGRLDEEYRAAIRFQIFINVSNAEPETIITAIRFVTQATRVRLWEIQDATIQLFTNGVIIPDDIVTFTESITAAGVNIEYITASLNTLPFSFTLDGPNNPEGGGWNELGYTPGGSEVGGQWAEGFFI